MKTCLICDDHMMLREALAGAVEFGWPQTQIVQAATFPAGWAAAAMQPDLIISDLGMPGAGPVEGIRGLRAAAPGAPLLVVSGVEEDAVLLDLLKLGIAGLAPKSSKGGVIEAAIRQVLAGGRYLSPRASELAARLDAQDAVSAGPGTAALTARQKDVLRLIAAGESNREIGRALDLSPATIKAHIAAALAALGVADQAQAVTAARARGLI